MSGVAAYKNGSGAVGGFVCQLLSSGAQDNLVQVYFS